ncbi:MAG TPA: serine/threonine-protein kinase [Kofleriaceae bacterium]
MRSSEGGHESAALAASDTAVAGRTSASDIGRVDTDAVPKLDRGLLADLVGVTLSGRYIVKRKVGQGGMGAVYEATHAEIGGRYAVKVLLEKYAKRDAIVARLKQEAQLATSLDNEHIIRVTDFGNTDDGRTYVVMEFLDGESLAECLGRETQLPEQRILRIAAQTASALADAHKNGIIHRDIKPENVFMLKRKDQDFVKVVDFGISKSLRSSDEQEDQPRLTQTGMVLGTPLYMSPEQARGDENLDHRVDLYALGVIMYEAATGRVPFSGQNYLSVISQVLNEEPTSVRELRPEISEEFDAIVQKAMAKDREHRYVDAAAMLADLNAVLDDPTRSTERAKITGPRRLLVRPKIPKLAYAIGGVGVLVGGIAIVVVLLMGGGGPDKKAKRVAAVAKPIDAGVAALAIDAGPPRPEAETIKVQVHSVPIGAEIFGADDGRDYGTTPCDIPLVVHDEPLKLIAQFNGYDDDHFSINPLAQKAQNAPVKIKLKRAVGRAPNTTKLVKQPGSGSAGPKDQTAGTFHGDPFQGSGSLPK